MEARTDVATACAPFALAAFLVLAAIALLATPAAAQPKPSAIVIQQSDIKWNSGPGGSRTSTLIGGGPGPGRIISITDWASGQISHAHYHSRDRTFVVLKGHWDFSAGPSDDVAGLKALPEGTIVHVPAGAPFKDGCKQGPCLILTFGESDRLIYVNEQGQDLPPTPRPQGAQ
jgi:quercetin dioxygenase-like cupin family protein